MLREVAVVATSQWAPGKKKEARRRFLGNATRRKVEAFY
jgi:hypothetical protein